MTPMTTADAATARLALVEGVRRLEWRLAFDAGRAIGRAEGAVLARQHAHELGNVVQIVDLGVAALGKAVPATDALTAELMTELHAAAETGKTTLAQMLAARIPARAAGSGAPAAGVIDAAIAAGRAADLELDAAIEVEPGVRTPLAVEALEVVVCRMLLDIEAGPIQLLVRERVIEGNRWLELIRTSAAAPASDAIAALVEGAGGEVSESETRTGAIELVVALPIL
jgi:hypothetical protein